MSHTFDIRFARSAGLAALLEAPENTFRWKGGGFLHIDSEGVSIAVKRGLLSLFTRKAARRIAAAELTDVYREGDALRLEFSTADARRAVMPFWVRDRDTAAEIVRLLPTQRTVELDDAVRQPARRFRVDVRLVAWTLTALAVVSLGIALLVRHPAPLSVDAASVPGTADVAPAPAPTTAPAAPVAPEAVPALAQFPPGVEPLDAFPIPMESWLEIRVPAVTLPVDDADDDARSASDRDAWPRVNPIMPWDGEYAAARRQLDWFEAEVQDLRTRGAGAQGWRELAWRIQNRDDFWSFRLARLVDAELAALRECSDYLDGHGRRAQAERLLEHVRLYVY